MHYKSEREKDRQAQTHTEKERKSGCMLERTLSMAVPSPMGWLQIEKKKLHAPKPPLPPLSPWWILGWEAALVVSAARVSTCGCRGFEQLQWSSASMTLLPLAGTEDGGACPEEAEEGKRRQTHGSILLIIGTQYMSTLSIPRVLSTKVTMLVVGMHGNCRSSAPGMQKSDSHVF